MTMIADTGERFLQSNQKHIDLDTNEAHHDRKASLDDVEQAFLKALLIDPPTTTSKPTGIMSTHTRPTNEKKNEYESKENRILNDDILFSVPEGLATRRDGVGKRPFMVKKPEDYRLQVGLWQAHEDGVPPKVLSRMASLASSNEEEDIAKDLKGDVDDLAGDSVNGENFSTDHELSKEHSGISLTEDDSSSFHFDAWEVLKDVYAQEHGFDYKPLGVYEEESELSHNSFKIIGTSADDKSSHPHVMSPPLMDAIMNYLPEHLRNQNYWMKFSLVRDGASLETLKAYVRGSKDNILAIETTRGEVFGMYTSSPWRTSPTMYGGTPSFVWKMRYNRNKPCHSLIEQATLESEIDAYPLADRGAHVQLCTHNKIGVGVGNMNRYDDLGNVAETEEEEEQRYGKNYGFAIALQDDLLSGTTSRSSCYKSPCFVNPASKGEPFEVLNLEIWTLTSAFSLESAEKLEMTQYFISESVRSSIRRSSDGSIRSAPANETFSSRDLNQQSFYRRVGHDDSHEELRDQWQLRQMMDGAGAGSRGVGASPRFSK